MLLQKVKLDLSLDIIETISLWVLIVLFHFIMRKTKPTITKLNTITLQEISIKQKKTY